MNINRIKAILLHSWYHFSHSMESWVDMIWFPVVNFLVLGMIAVFIVKEKRFTDSLILGFLFWTVIHVVQHSVTISILWEIWHRNFLSLFVTPLTLQEFIFSQMIFGMAKAIVMFTAISFMAFFLFGFSVLKLGWLLPVYFMESLIFGWAAGIFIIGIIMRFGTDIQSFAWSLILLVQPIAAVFYPVAALPKPVQFFSYIFPVTYLMEAIRSHLAGEINYYYILIATLLNLVFLISSLAFLHKMHIRARKTGKFVRIDN